MRVFCGQCPDCRARRRVSDALSLAIDACESVSLAVRILLAAKLLASGRFPVGAC